MGTNYYHDRDVCPTCNRPAESVHIGKSSMGWTFSFHGTPETRSYRKWLDVLEAGGLIRNEYGEVVTLDAFKALVESKRNEKHNHTTYCRLDSSPDIQRYGWMDCWLDAEGHSFSEGDFS
jgi:hypothetical protein